jgi:hypothetical protein
MTGSDLEPEPAAPFAAVWKHVGHLEDRIAAQETWRASVEAVSTWRRWVFPLIFSAVALVLTATDLILKYH